MNAFSWYMVIGGRSILMLQGGSADFCVDRRGVDHNRRAQERAEKEQAFLQSIVVDVHIRFSPPPTYCTLKSMYDVVHLSRMP